MSSLGIVKVNTSSAIQSTEISVTIVIGLQNIIKKLNIEVYDCMKGIEFAPGLKVQMGSPIQEFNAVKSNPNQERCGKNILHVNSGEGLDFVLQHQSANNSWQFKKPK